MVEDGEEKRQAGNKAPSREYIQIVWRTGNAALDEGKEELNMNNELLMK